MGVPRVSSSNCPQVYNRAMAAEAPLITQRSDETDWSSGDFLEPDIKNGLLLEIGASHWPVFTWSETALRSLRRGMLYINVENFRPKSGLVKSTGLGEDILGDLETLPVSSESADEVWVSNVFGLQAKPTNTTKNYFNELSRVLKPDGRIYIVGWYTPRDSAWLQKEDMAQYNLQTEDIFDQEKLLEFIDRFGITENVSKYLKVGDIPQDVIPFKSFVMVLKKTAQ